MTENERLRALLAEARDAMRCGCYIDCPIEDEPSFYERIDAALAEPVVSEWEQRGVADDKMIAALREAQIERDEARAEVERLRPTINAGRGLAPVESPIDFDHEWVRQREAVAYQRGAEVMREAAASLFDAPPSVPERDVLLAWANSIRALPVPEDE